jgi:hypothetical protein
VWQSASAYQPVRVEVEVVGEVVVDIEVVVVVVEVEIVETLKYPFGYSYPLFHLF